MDVKCWVRLLLTVVAVVCRNQIRGLSFHSVLEFSIETQHVIFKTKSVDGVVVYEGGDGLLGPYCSGKFSLFPVYIQDEALRVGNSSR